MILVLGGTSETTPVVERLMDCGYDILVSTATDLSLSLPDHDRVERRSGILDREQLSAIIRKRNIKLVLDVTHPYAAEISRNARAAARDASVPCLRLERPPVIEHAPDVTFAANHEEAAREACHLGDAVLLTIGTRNLTPYVEEACRAEVDLYARVLPVESAVKACAAAGIDRDHQIHARGPCSVEENCKQICEHSIEVLVTRDSGRAGGTPEKLAAARAEKCEIITIQRPEIVSNNVCDTIAELVGEAVGNYPT